MWTEVGNWYIMVWTEIRRNFMRKTLKGLILAVFFTMTTATCTLAGAIKEEATDDDIIAQIMEKHSYERGTINHEGWIYYTKIGTKDKAINGQIFRVREDGTEDMSLGAIGDVERIEGEWIFFRNRGFVMNSSRNRQYKMKLDGTEKTEIIEEDITHEQFLRNIKEDGILVVESVKSQYIAYEGHLYSVSEDGIFRIIDYRINDDVYYDNQVIYNDHFIYRNQYYLIDLNLKNDEIKWYYLKNFGLGYGVDKFKNFDKKLFELGEDGERYIYFTEKETDKVLSLRIGDSEPKVIGKNGANFQKAGEYVYFLESDPEGVAFYRSRFGTQEKEKVQDGFFRIENEIEGWLYISNYPVVEGDETTKSLFRCRPDGSELSTIYEKASGIFFVDGWIYQRDGGETYRTDLDGGNRVKIGDDIHLWRIYGDFITCGEYDSEGHSTNYIMEKDGSARWEIGKRRYYVQKYQGDYLYYYDWVKLEHFCQTPGEAFKEFMYTGKMPADKYKSVIHKYNTAEKKMEWERAVDFAPPKYLFDKNVGTVNFLKRNPVFDMRMLQGIRVENIFSRDAKEEIASKILECDDDRFIYSFELKFSDYVDVNENFDEKLAVKLQMIAEEIFREHGIQLAVIADASGGRRFHSGAYHRVQIYVESWEFPQN